MPISATHLDIEGKRYVLLPADEYEALCGRAGAEVALDESDLPPLPKPDKKGRFPAVEYTRVALARDIIRGRRTAGLTQQGLADLAGLRQETICRIEKAGHSASPKTVERIEKAIAKALKQKQKG